MCLRRQRPVVRPQLLFRVSQMLLFHKNVEKRTRRTNNSQNLPASQTKRTQGRNIPFGGTPHSDILYICECPINGWYVLYERARGSKLSMGSRAGSAQLGSAQRGLGLTLDHCGSSWITVGLRWITLDLRWITMHLG